MSVVSTVVIDDVEREVTALDHSVIHGQPVTLVRVIGDDRPIASEFWHYTSDIALVDREKFIKGRCFMGLPTQYCEVHYGRCMSHRF